MFLAPVHETDYLAYLDRIGGGDGSTWGRGRDKVEAVVLMRAAVALLAWKPQSCFPTFPLAAPCLSSTRRET